MNEADRLYLNKQQHGSIMRKNYANCPNCNAINLFTPDEVVYEDEKRKYYHFVCWSCKTEFDA